MLFLWAKCSFSGQARSDVYTGSTFVMVLLILLNGLLPTPRKILGGRITKTARVVRLEVSHHGSSSSQPIHTVSA